MWSYFFFLVTYRVVVFGVDFKMEGDGFFVVAYGVVVCGVDLNV